MDGVWRQHEAVFGGGGVETTLVRQDLRVHVVDGGIHSSSLRADQCNLALKLGAKITDGLNHPSNQIDCCIEGILGDELATHDDDCGCVRRGGFSGNDGRYRRGGRRFKGRSQLIPKMIWLYC